MSRRNKIAAAVFGVIVVGAFIIAAATGGVTHKSVPSDDVAIVGDVKISQDDFDHALELAKKQQGVTDTPAPGSDEYNQLRDSVMDQLIQSEWIKAEAQDQGLDATDSEVADKLAQIKQQQFKGEADFQKFLKQSGYTADDVNQRVTTNIYTDKLKNKINEDAPQVTDEDAQQYYDENKNTPTFQQPASRDIRQIVSKDAKDIAAAKAALEADDSDANWEKVAKKYSQDKATNQNGGLKAGVQKGTLGGDLDTAVFDADPGTIQGPVSGADGSYVFEVTKDTPESTQPLDDQLKQQIIQQLQSQRQQEYLNEFVIDFQNKWTDVTVCADGYVMQECSNFEGDPSQSGQPECTAEVAKQSGCPTPVTLRSPFAPGADALETQGGQGGTPQRPHPPGEDPDENAAPGGAIPGGVPGAGGAVPVSPTG